MIQMASADDGEKVLVDPSPDEGKPLLLSGDARRSESSTNGVPQPAGAAHRKRITALLQLVWDSGVICICGASIVFSLAALFVKLLGSGVPVFQIVAVRSVSSFIVCAAYARATHITPFFGHRSNLRFLIARGLFGASAMTTYYFSLKMLPLADAVTLFFLNPAITAVAAWAIMKEPLGLRGACGVLVSMCGLVLLTRPPFIFGALEQQGSSSGDSASLHGDGGLGVGTAAAGGWDGLRLLGTMFGLLSAVLSAGAFISIRHIGKSEPALVMSVYFHMTAALSSLAPLAAGVPAPAVWPSGVQWALLLGIACCSFWGQIFIGRAFQLLNAARASAINLTQVVYSYILGLLFLGESLTLLGAGGSVLIGAGAVLVNWKPKKQPQPAEQQPGQRVSSITGRPSGSGDGSTVVVVALSGGLSDGKGAGAHMETGSNCKQGSREELAVAVTAAVPAAERAPEVVDGAVVIGMAGRPGTDGRVGAERQEQEALLDLCPLATAEVSAPESGLLLPLSAAEPDRSRSQDRGLGSSGGGCGFKMAGAQRLHGSAQLPRAGSTAHDADGGYGDRCSTPESKGVLDQMSLSASRSLLVAGSPPRAAAVAVADQARHRSSWEGNATAAGRVWAAGPEGLQGYAAADVVHKGGGVGGCGGGVVGRQGGRADGVAEKAVSGMGSGGDARASLDTAQGPSSKAAD